MKTFKTRTAQTLAIIAMVSALSTPIQAHAAKLPGTCDLVQNTLCGSAPSILERILSIMKWA